MTARDHHSALRIEPSISQILPGTTPTAQLATVKLQWGKDDSAYSLHIAPLAPRTRAGVQRTDFLTWLGFEHRRPCQFVSGQQCYVRWIPETFNQESFWQSFERSYSALLTAQQELDACGLTLTLQAASTSDAHGGRVNAYPLPSAAADGHTVPKSESISKAEDEQFRFSFSLLEAPTVKGWVTHYCPKHPPLSPELEAVFRFLGLAFFPNCPQFDFEGCYWRFIPFRRLGQILVTAEGAATSNAIFARKNFDAHAQRFSRGLQALLAANTAVEPFGMSFLQMRQSSRERADSEIKRHTSEPECAGINRHVVGDERALRERRQRIHPGLESCKWHREVLLEA